MNELTIILLASLIIFFAFYTRSLLGFGGALISIPLLAFLFNLKIAVPMEAIFEVILSLLLIRSEYKKINWKMLIPVVIGAAIGTLLGTFFLKSLDTELLRKILGAVIILFSLNLIRKQIQETQPVSNIVGVIAGLVGGTLGGIFGTSGPPFVLFMANKIKDKAILRATLIGLFTIDFSWRIVVFMATGLFTSEVLKYTLYLTPALILGTIAGSLTFFKVSISEKRYKQLVAGLLIIAGILLILK
jgi:uncharacterized membrane protein YfcA